MHRGLSFRTDCTDDAFADYRMRGLRKTGLELLRVESKEFIHGEVR